MTPVNVITNGGTVFGPNALINPKDRIQTYVTDIWVIFQHSGNLISIHSKIFYPSFYIDNNDFLLNLYNGGILLFNVTVGCTLLQDRFTIIPKYRLHMTWRNNWATNTWKVIGLTLIWRGLPDKTKYQSKQWKPTVQC